MKKAWAAALMLGATVVHAESEARYSFTFWGNLSGQGFAIVGGPFDSDHCDSFTLTMRTGSSDTPPDMQLAASLCLDKGALQRFLAQDGCQFGSQQKLPKSAASVWNYRCFQP